jgi:DNA-binding transcriptional ArsR family regulator
MAMGSAARPTICGIGQLVNPSVMLCSVSMERDVFAVLADPTRRQVLDLLSRRERAAGDLGRAFPEISQPGMSRHLRVLREAGLVRVRAERRNRYYSLRSERLAEVDAWISKYRGFWETELNALEAHMDAKKRARSEKRA